MATKTFSGQLDQAIEGAASGNKLLFVPQENLGEVLMGAASEMVVGDDGTYSITLAYNTYSVYHYSDVTKCKILIADGVEVSASTSVSTIPDLIGVSVPVTDSDVLTNQGYLQEGQDYAASAKNSANASASLYNNFNKKIGQAIEPIETGVPSLDIPFNDSGILKKGVGTEYVSDLPVYGVDFTRSTTSTVINKSGVLETLAADEMGIGSDGIWLHGAYTNEHPYGNNPYSWSGGSANVTGSGTYAGVTMYLVSDTNTAGNASVRYDFSSTLSADTNYYLQFLVKNVDADESKITLQGAMSSTIEIDITWDGNDISDITDAYYYRKISDDVYLIVSEVKSTSSSVGVINNYVFPASFVSGGTTTGSIYVGAMMVIQSDTPKELPFILTDGAAQSATATSCTVPVSGNLPASGESFTVVCDSYVDGSSSDSEYSNYFSIGTSSDYIGLAQSRAGVLRVQHSLGTWFAPSASTTGSISRLTLVCDPDTAAGTTDLSLYQDGELLSSQSFSATLGDITGGTVNFGASSSGTTSLNQAEKNFKILPYAASADEVKSWGAPK